MVSNKQIEIMMYFFSNSNLSLKKIGEKFGTTGPYVSKIISKALEMTAQQRAELFRNNQPNKDGD